MDRAVRGREPARVDRAEAERLRLTSVVPARVRRRRASFGRRTLVGVEAPTVVLELVERDDPPVVALRLGGARR